MWSVASHHSSLYSRIHRTADRCRQHWMGTDHAAAATPAPWATRTAVTNSRLATETARAHRSRITRRMKLAAPVEGARPGGVKQTDLRAPPCTCLLRSLLAPPATARPPTNWGRPWQTTIHRRQNHPRKRNLMRSARVSSLTVRSCPSRRNKGKRLFATPRQKRRKKF